MQRDSPTKLSLRTQVSFFRFLQPSTPSVMLPAFRRLLAYPTAKYIERDDSLVRTLQQLRRAGKKTFLLTNSFWPYVDIVMKHLVQSET